MNTLDREIMKALLIEEQSIYGIQKAVEESKALKKSECNYASVLRHVKRMEKEGLLKIAKDKKRKNGKLDRRGTEKPFLTSKGLATLLIEGDLQERELSIVGRKALQEDFKRLPRKSLQQLEPYMIDIFCDSLLELKPKVNLRFFDEKWFGEVYWSLIVKSIQKAIKKYHVKFEKEGIWETEAERRKKIEELLESDDNLKKGRRRKKDDKQLLRFLRNDFEGE